MLGWVASVSRVWCVWRLVRALLFLCQGHWNVGGVCRLLWCCPCPCCCCCQPCGHGCGCGCGWGCGCGCGCYIYIYIKAVLYYIAAIPVGFNNLCLCLRGSSWLVIAIRMFWTHLDSPGLTRTHLDPPGTHLELSQTHLESLGIIWTHLDSLGLTWIHLDSMTFGLTWAHLDSLVLTWSHLDSFSLTWIRVFKWYRLKPMHCHSSSIIPMLKPMHTSTNEQLDPYNDKSQWLKPMCTAATLLAGLTRRACCYSHRFQVLSHVSCCYLHVFLMGPLETNAKTMHSLFPSLKAWLWHITSHQ